MAYNFGRITGPVSIYDVQRAIGTGLSDLGAVIASGLYNRWSKYKPVPLALIDTVTGQWDSSAESDLFNDKWKDTSTWFKGGVTGYTQAYGWAAFFSNNPLTALTPYLNHATDPKNGWVSQTPAGGVNTPYRLQDFAGYNHNAYEPPTIYSCDEDLVVPNNAAGVTITPTYLKRTTDDNVLRRRSYITPKDVLLEMWASNQSLDFHEGFAIIDFANNKVKAFTTDGYMKITQDNIGTGDLQLQRGQDYYVVPFFCDKAYPKDPTLDTDFIIRTNIGKISPMPFMEPVIMHISTDSTQPLPGVSSSLTAINDGGAAVYGQFTLVMTDGGSHTLHDVTVVISLNGQDVRQHNYGTFSLSSQTQSVTQQYRISIVGVSSGVLTATLYGKDAATGTPKKLRGPVNVIEEDPTIVTN